MSHDNDQQPKVIPPWGIPATVAWLLFAFLVSIVVATAVFGAVQADRSSVRASSYDGVVITIGAMASVPVQIAVLAFAARLRRWSPAEYLGLVPPKRAEIVFALLCTVALVLVFDLLMYVSGRDLVPSFQVEAFQSAKDAGWLVALLLAIVVVAPIGEEIAFRGFLYRGLVRPGREWLAIVAIALAWALLHIQYDWLGMAQIFAAGLILGWFRWASGSTVLTIVMHVLINAEAMIETALKVEWFVVNAPDVDALGVRAEAMITELAAISAERGRLVRLFLSPEHRRAADLVARWMQSAGLAVTEDALGTVRGRFGGPGRRLLIGSHIDTVIDAGKYDGAFGVVAGILAAEHFVRAGAALPFGIDVLAFGDEEGSRFPATLTSSLACAGAFEPRMLTLADAKGVNLADALRAFGKSPADIPAAAYAAEEAAGYIEVHIEQGPVLEPRTQPLGVVTGIIGQTFLLVDIFGEAGHAGTVPMMLRRDALPGGAEVILLTETIARETQGELVATVGRLTIEPGAANVIPGHVVMSVDMRSSNDDARAQFVERFKIGCRDIADRRHLGITVTPTHEIPATPCDPWLQKLLDEAVIAVGAEPQRLGSGAGHDGQAMAKLCPIGMLFVRCRGGISHNPLEYTSPRDMGLSVAALIRFIERFTP